MEVIAEVAYDKKREIGGIAGKNSRVWLAYDHHLNAELIVKEIEKTTIGDPVHYFEEAKAVHASVHPRVVQIYWAAETTDRICIAMPFMPGGSLADAIKTKPLSPSKLIRVAQDICEGIAQVHIAGHVHLDIKPTNVLFDSLGRAAVADFGQALPLNAYGIADARGHRLYHPFTPPEVYKNKGAVTQVSDLYQIGLTLYRALNGEPHFAKQWSEVKDKPFPFARDAISNGEFPERVFLPHVPLGLRRAILKALNIDPQLRQVSARALAEELALVDVKYDWEMETTDQDMTLWRLQTPGRSDVLVTRKGVFPNASVEVWTETSSGRRRKNPEAWSKGLRTENQLRKAFAQAFRAAVI